MAAAVDVLSSAHEASADEDLSDEQIEELLARATARLQDNSVGKQVANFDVKSHYTFPKLNAGKLEKPYVFSKGAVASLDAARLLEEKQRKQANATRKVEDPLTAKRAALEVRILSSTRVDLAMRKIFPKLSRAESGHRLGRLSANMRVLLQS